MQFANLSYQGEHLAGYAGERVIIRYNPRDITTVLIYQQDSHQERFLTRAHAVGLETEILAFSEAQAMSRRVRSCGKAVTNQSVLMEVRDREATVSFNKIFDVVNRINNGIKKRVKGRVGEGLGESSTG